MKLKLFIVPAVLLALFTSRLSTNCSAQQIIDVTQYGANGRDSLDDGPAFRQAIADAERLSVEPVIVQIPAGDYYFYPEPDLEGHLNLTRVSNLTLQGEPGTKFIMKDWRQSGILVFYSDRVTLKNIAIDYDPLPFTQGDVIAVNTAAKTMDVVIDDKFPLPLNPQFTETDKWAYIFSNGFIDHQFLDLMVNDVAHIQGRTYRLAINHPNADFVGHQFVLTGRGGKKAAAFKIGRSSGPILIEKATVLSSPTTAFQLIDNNEVVTINDCMVRAAEGRLLSTNADAIHGKANRAPAIITGCTFSGMGDDGINIGGTFEDIFVQVDSSTLIIQRKTSYSPGDRVQVCSGIDGSVIVEAVVESLSHSTWGEESSAATILILDKPVNVSRTLDNGFGNNPDVVGNLETTGAGMEVSRNIFTYHRGRGIMLHTPKASVQRNIFHNIEGPGIVLGPDLSWNEAMAGSGSTITSNIFFSVRRTNIQIATAGGVEDAAYGMGTSDILIKGNYFFDYGQPSVSGRGVVGNVFSCDQAAGVTFNGNIIGKPFIDSDNANKQVILKRCKNIRLTDNVFRGETIETATSDPEWLEVYPTARDIKTTEDVFTELFNYPTETALDSAWQQVDTAGGNPLQLNEEGAAQIGNVLLYRELPQLLENDWQLSFDMKHSTQKRGGWVGLFDDTGRSGYVVMWDSGNTQNGYLQIRKIHLNTSIDNWRELGERLANTPVIHERNSEKFSQLSLSWDSDSGMLKAWMDGIEYSSVVDNEFKRFSKIFIRGNGLGDKSDAVQIDNLKIIATAFLN